MKKIRGWNVAAKVAGVGVPRLKSAVVAGVLPVENETWRKKEVVVFDEADLVAFRKHDRKAAPAAHPAPCKRAGSCDDLNNALDEKNRALLAAGRKANVNRFLESDLACVKRELTEARQDASAAKSELSRMQAGYTSPVTVLAMWALNQGHRVVVRQDGNLELHGHAVAVAPPAGPSGNPWGDAASKAFAGCRPPAPSGGAKP